MITVLGARGFVGSHVVSHLQRNGIDHHAPARGETLDGRDLGDVIYCIGLTGDFHERVHDTVEAHVTYLLDVVQRCTFDSILYLSSTRLYLRGTGREDDELGVNPLDPGDLYNLSKLTGEAIALSLGARGRVARLSNVYGPGLEHSFLASVLADATQRGEVILRTALDSTRDYVAVDDVARLLVQIAQGGRERIYNVASGIQITHAELLAAIPGCRVAVEPGAPTVRHPDIDVHRIRGEFGFEPAHLLDELSRT